MTKQTKFNYWKIIAILFFLFGVVLFFYSEAQNKEILNSIDKECGECVLKKEVCIFTLNQTLISWKECLYSLANVYNFTEELDKTFEDLNNETYNMVNQLNNKEVIK